MTDLPSHDPRPRNPFEGFPQPEPFYRSPEFLRFLWLAGLLLVVASLGYGFFAREHRRRAAERAAEEQAAELPVLLGPGEQEARERRLATLFEGALRDSENGTDFEQTLGYRRLLQILERYSREEVERLAVRKLDFDAAMKDPDAWRGEFVWARGVVALLYAERLQEPLFETKDVYRGVLTDGDGQNGVFFDLPEEPPPISIRKQPVDVFGVFYRTVKYEPLRPEKGETTREAPYLLVRTIRPVERPGATATSLYEDPFALSLVGAALAIVAARLLIYGFQRRSRRPPADPRSGPPGRGAGFKDMFEKRLRQDKRTAGPRSEP